MPAQIAAAMAFPGAVPAGPQTPAAARALLGWSQSKLARTAGVGLSTLQGIEQNKGVVKGTSPPSSRYKKPLNRRAFARLSSQEPRAPSFRTWRLVSRLL